ncbi:uncharacterized protein LOC124274643 [Haliotis rubra]|uniref:uncharacterized protein LOC124274643 n=1 Tax=Haliotis rubra TaxID=36100 RepID=UPI001EE60EA9|nr:uncharacterized protein LOC124274643 [Haliotis rubra]
MVFLQSVNILEICVVLLHILCPFVYNMDTCTNVTFHWRPEMDDLVFTGSLIEEMNQVDMRAECFSRCQWRVLCNLVLYNPLTKTCRLHSEAFDPTSDGIFESGWQYYGVACDNYRLANSQENVDVIATDIEDICNTSYFTVDSNISSCLRGASWKTVKIKCVPCYNGTTQQPMKSLN